MELDFCSSMSDNIYNLELHSNLEKDGNNESNFYLSIYRYDDLTV